MSFDFSEKVVMITGAGRGIGRGVAEGYAVNGAHVVLLDQDAQSGKDAVKDICSGGGKARFWHCDVSIEAEVEKVVAEVVGQCSRIDILVNNAGINRRRPLMEYTEDDFNEVVGVNFFGAFCVARAVGRQMMTQRDGVIINIAALGGGVVGLGRGTAVYCATKGALVALTRDLAAEWSSFGIRVNAVAPGWIKTPMNAPLLAHETASQRVVERVPLSRWGEVSDVVGPVMFLSSESASYITGHVIPVDGGAAAIIQLTDDTVIR